MEKIRRYDFKHNDNSNDDIQHDDAQLEGLIDDTQNTQKSA
jgi:hypothetical protein